MRLGIPMQIVESRGTTALCVYRGETTLIDLSLVGEQAVGTWLLVLLKTAREVISAEQAQHISDRLEAMRLAMQGQSKVGHLFPDLANQEPKLPEVLR